MKNKKNEEEGPKNKVWNVECYSYTHAGAEIMKKELEQKFKEVKIRRRSNGTYAVKTWNGKTSG
jgi:hypothetical protein